LLVKFLVSGEGPAPDIDLVRSRPLIMSFCRLFGLGDDLHPSRPAESGFMEVIHGQARGGR
jgi:hypothetical protein